MELYNIKDVGDIYENPDYTGNTNGLINPINQLITNKFMPMVKEKLDKVLKVPYKSFHLVLSPTTYGEEKQVAELDLTFEYTDNLCNGNPFDDYMETIQEAIDGCFTEMGYPIDEHDPIATFDKLAKDIPQVADYFEIR